MQGREGQGEDIFTLFMRIILQIFLTLPHLYTFYFPVFACCDEYFSIFRGKLCFWELIGCEIVFYYNIVKLSFKLNLNLISFPVTKRNIRWELILRAKFETFDKF